MIGGEEKLKDSKTRNSRMLEVALKEPLTDVFFVFSLSIQSTRT